MSMMAVLGILGTVVVATLSPWLVEGVLKMPEELRPETLTTFYLLAFSIPIVIGTTGLRGILEAHQRFGLVNAVRIPLGIIPMRSLHPEAQVLYLPIGRYRSALAPGSSEELLGAD